MHLPEIHLYRPRAHHDDAGTYIVNNHVDLVRLKRYKDLELLPVYHVHDTKISLLDADKIIQETEREERYDVVGVKDCDSSKDTGDPRGSFIILKRKESVPEQKPVEQKPSETLTPETVGKRLFEAFEGYDRSARPSRQLSSLLRRYLVHPAGDGSPVYTLTSPAIDEPISPWREYWRAFLLHDPATTETHEPHSPHILPWTVQNAHELITMTHMHHSYKTLRAENHDVLITRDNNIITPFWYIKGKQPIQPQPLVNLEDMTSEALWRYPGVLIQLWKFLPEKNTYQQQANLGLTKISLTDFLRALETQEDLR